jgi:hypothetical protein
MISFLKRAMWRPMSASATPERGRPNPGRHPGVLIPLFFSLFLPVIPIAAQAPSSAEDILAFRFTMAGGAIAGPTAVAGRVWVISENKTLYILNDTGKAVGKRPWKEGAPSWMAPDAFGRVLLPAQDGSLLLVNRAGVEVYRVRPGASVTEPAVFGADGRFFVAAGARLMAYSAAGRRLWSVDLGAPAARGPSVRYAPSDGARIAVALRDGSVREYDEYGSLKAKVEAGNPVAILSPLGDDLLVIRSGGFASIRDGEGHELAKTRLSSTPLAASGDENAAWMLFPQGLLVRMEADGKLGSTINTGVPDARAVEVFRERVLVLGNRGVASVSKTGEVFRDLALRNAPRLPAATASGLVVSAGEDWILYAYHFERNLGDPPLPPLGAVDFAAARARADEEAFWNPDFASDDGIMGELGRIEKSAESDSIGAGEADALGFCSAIAMGYGVREASPYGGAAPAGPRPSSALPRATACDILGTLGSPRAVSALTEVYLHDPDPVVRASAAQAIGAIGLDPSGEALRAFQWAADREFFLDDRGAMATLDAVAGIYRALGELSDTAGIHAAMKLAGKPYSSAVRNRALAVLRRLSEPAR